jgi:predicted outer membrane repeat protein
MRTSRSIGIPVFVLVLLLRAAPAEALVFWVGPDGNCDYNSLQAAINALGSDPGPHELLLKAGTLAIANGVNIERPANQITIRGGYQSCQSLSDTGTTILDATGGSDGTAININAGNRATQQTIIFERVSIRGGNSETGPFDNPEGGGLEVRGHVRVRLRTLTLIHENSSGKGGGVYMEGASLTRPAELTIELGAEIRDNTASTRGGGIYCHHHGMISLNRGQISFNQANTGGGIDMRQGCSLLTSAPTSASAGFNGLMFNEAAISGGAIFAAPDGSRWPTIYLAGATGSPGNPLVFLNNNAPIGAGIHLDNAYDSASYVYLANTIWSGQHSTTSGATIHLEGRVDVEIEAWPDCRVDFFGAPSCSGFYHNTSEGWAGVVSNFTSDSTLKIYRTHMDANQGDPATVLFFGEDVHIESSIFGNNIANNQTDWLPARNSLFTLHGEATNRLRYSTVLANQVGYLLTTVASVNPTPGSIDLSGSILYAPGTEIWRSWDGHPMNVFHFGCLLAHTSSGISEPGVIVADPLLRADFSPSDNSPALDICDNIPGAPLPDFYGHPRGVNQVVVPNLWGPHDLGAVERTDQVAPLVDELFSDRFQQ